MVVGFIAVAALPGKRIRERMARTETPAASADTVVHGL
jgi:hypothetical protein